MPLLHAAMAEIEPVTLGPRGWALVTAHATESAASNDSDRMDRSDGDSSSSNSNSNSNSSSSDDTGSTDSGVNRELASGEENFHSVPRQRNGPLKKGHVRAAFVCCQDDGTHATCSTTCRAPHD